MLRQITIDKFCQPSPGPKPTTSVRRSGAGGEATPTPGSRPPLSRRRLSLPSTSTPTGTDNPGSTGVSTPAETSDVRPTAAPSPSESSTTPSPHAGTDPSPTVAAPSMATASNLRAGSRSAPKSKRRQPGSPRGLGSPTPRRKQKRENSAENDDTLQEITNLMPEGQQSTVDVGANCPPGSSTPADAGTGSAHPTTDQSEALPATGVTTGSASPARSCGLENDESLQEITNKSKQNDRSAEVTGEEGQQSAVDVGANCPPGSSTPADAGTGSAHPTTDQPEASPSTGVTTGSPSPARSCGLENDESLQVTSKKKCKKEFPGEKEKEIAEVMFRVKVDETGLTDVFEIRAPANQPILHALQADTRLEKVKKRLSKIYLHPCGNNNPIRGVPNIGSPCRVIEGGTFQAGFHGKVQICNMYSDDELKSSERFKVYLDVVRNRKNKMSLLTKENWNTFYLPILVDCLPNDTLLSALLRDARIDSDRVKCTKLFYTGTGSTGQVNISLKDKPSSHDDKTFTYQVLPKKKPKTPQVSDEDWEKACADSAVESHSPQATPSIPDVALSGAKVGNGTPDPQDIADMGSGGPHRDWVTLMARIIIPRSKRQVAELLELDLEEKDSPTSEENRTNELDKFVKKKRRDFCSANPGIRISLMEKCCELGRSVGVLKKNDHRYGTCFLLCYNFALTNKHVIEEMAKVGGDSYVEFSYKFLQDPDLFEFKVKRVVCTSNGNDLDYSLLELDVPDDQSDRLPPGLGHLIASSSKAKLVTIIGHPGGRPQEANICCPIVDPDHKNIKTIAVYLKFNPEPTGGANYGMVDDPGRVTYRSVFGPGSSGSPGFDEEGKLIVMHTCGYPLYKGSSSLVEQGVKMTAIRDDLEQRDDHDLSAELFPTESMETD
ncbi:uncharacterized protein LOC118431163 isoform X2 [Branchiostoma floridae]|uniref:Uncharacterized protein LOC118431163 isoform X2 n=1 Tax=Branchiostoma floridae TaxID=7739 RepID=A0A9J7MBI1_BRAFL|nr:uncharacterized protein LOC118431163 isoform X2 [Branchiostoma floridae]